MKYIQEDVGTYRRSQALCDKVPSKPGYAPAVALELKALRLAADAADIRRELTPQQLAKHTRLAVALDACEALFEEFGWGDQPEPADCGDESGD